MMSRVVRLLLVGIVFGLLTAGCNMGGGKTPLARPRPQPAEVFPPHIAGTVAEYAALAGGGDVAVQGYGLVMGLGKNGSSEVPAHLREHFNQYLRKHKISSSRGEDESSPSDILRDLDTAVVLVRGVIPPGAPAGTRFDVEISALPETQTRSLDGGVLLPTEMHLAATGPETAGRQSRSWAEASGPMFVNPFLNFADSKDQSKFREARVIGGGKTTVSQSIRLQLQHADYQRADLIQTRIRDRFGPNIATAKDDSTVEIRIPPAYVRDYQPFLQLIMHLPLRQGSGNWETQAREIAAAMEGSGANHDELALVWEAMGRQVLPVVQKLYNSPNQTAAYYAGRAGMRLEDRLGTEVVARYAQMKGSPLQIKAIEELGKYGRTGGANVALHELLDDENEMVRIAAYEALRQRGDTARIRRSTIKGQFDLDVVTSSRKSVVYASQCIDQRLVLFGGDITVRRPLFFNAPGDVVTVHASSPEDELSIFRVIPRTGRNSQTFQAAPRVEDLVRLMGTMPDPGTQSSIYGLGLTYGQVVGILQRMCQEKDIQAEFRLQVLPEVQKIYKGSVTVGRPDMPGS